MTFWEMLILNMLSNSILGFLAKAETVFALSSFFKAKSDLLTNVVEFFLKNSSLMIFIGMVFVSIVIIGIAIKISILIMEKKEY